MLRKPTTLTSKFNIQQYIQNTTQKAKRFNRTSTQLLWEDFYESSGRGDQQICILNDSDELSPTNEKVAFRLPQQITVTRTFLDFLRYTLHIKEKQTTQHYTKELYFW